MLSPLLGGSVFTFGLILATALLGIALGGLAYALVGRDRPATLLGFSVTCLLEAAAVAAGFALGDRARAPRDRPAAAREPGLQRPRARLVRRDRARRPPAGLRGRGAVPPAHRPARPRPRARGPRRRLGHRLQHRRGGPRRARRRLRPPAAAHRAGLLAPRGGAPPRPRPRWRRSLDRATGRRSRGSPRPRSPSPSVCCSPRPVPRRPSATAGSGRGGPTPGDLAGPNQTEDWLREQRRAVDLGGRRPRVERRPPRLDRPRLRGERQGGRPLALRRGHAGDVGAAGRAPAPRPPARPGGGPRHRLDRRLAGRRSGRRARGRRGARARGRGGGAAVRPGQPQRAREPAAPALLRRRARAPARPRGSATTSSSPSRRTPTGPGSRASSAASSTARSPRGSRRAASSCSGSRPTRSTPGRSAASTRPWPPSSPRSRRGRHCRATSCSSARARRDGTTSRASVSGSARSRSDRALRDAWRTDRLEGLFAHFVAGPAFAERLRLHGLPRSTPTTATPSSSASRAASGVSGLLDVEAVRQAAAEAGADHPAFVGGTLDLARLQDERLTVYSSAGEAPPPVEGRRRDLARRADAHALWTRRSRPAALRPGARRTRSRTGRTSWPSWPR